MSIKSDWQIEFVQFLSTAVVEQLVKDIERGKIPEAWDGVELRQLMADCFSREVYKLALTGSRKRDYNNHILVNNL